MLTQIRSSKLDRYMKCSGFAFLKVEEPEAGQAAAEGTAADEYLQHLIRGSVNIPSHASNGILFDADMIFYGGEIAKKIPKGANTQIEVKWQTRSGIWIVGHYDASFIQGSTLYIDDYKYGWKLVEPKRNWQLISYAIGEVMRQGLAFEKIVMRIHQPRPYHEDGETRSWEITYEELCKLKEEVEIQMERIASGFKNLETGPQCKYCPASAEVCPAFNKAVYEGIDHVLTDYNTGSLTDKQIAQQLRLLERTQEVLKQKIDSTRELAISRLKQGRLIPGYMTEASYGDRQWKPGVNKEVIQMMMPNKKIDKTELLSPAQIEKLGMPKEFLSGLTSRYFKGMKLVAKDANALGDKIFNNMKGK